MKRLLSALLVCSLLLGLPVTSRALTVVPRSFDELVARADTVFQGTVSAQESRWTGEGAERHIVTFVTFQVEQTLKGTAAATQTLRFLGGTVGDTTLDVPDQPRFTVGQKAVLFVVNNGRQFCPLVGVAQGRFHVVREAATGRERILTDEEWPVVSTAELGRVDAAGRPTLRRYAHTNTPALTAEEFKAQILGQVAAQTR